MSGCKCNCQSEPPYSPPKDRDAKVKKLLIWIVVLFIIVFLIGIIGFKYFFNLDWHDAFYHAALTTSTLGVDVENKTRSQKYFIAIYALVSGILFISLISAFIDHIVDVYQA